MTPTLLRGRRKVVVAVVATISALAAVTVGTGGVYFTGAFTSGNQSAATARFQAVPTVAVTAQGSPAGVANGVTGLLPV